MLEKKNSPNKDSNTYAVQEFMIAMKCVKCVGLCLEQSLTHVLEGLDMWFPMKLKKNT